MDDGSSSSEEEEAMKKEFALGSDDEDDEDYALETFLNVVVNVVSGDPISKDDVKSAFNSFVRARVARGDAASDAKAEALSVMRGAKEAKHMVMS
jgi:hypothetical protein